METLLNDPEWAKWSSSEIARRCGVSDQFVLNLRNEASSNRWKMDTRLVERNGVTYEMNTASIGRHVCK